MRPLSGGGATPIEPKKGASGTVTPGAKATLVGARRQAQQLELGVGEVVGQHAAAGAERVDAEVVQELDGEHRTSSVSPGSAPSTKIGPVIGCAPGPRSVTRLLHRLERLRDLGLATPRAAAAAVRRATIVSTRTRSPDAMRSTGVTFAS